MQLVKNAYGYFNIGSIANLALVVLTGDLWSYMGASMALWEKLGQSMVDSTLRGEMTDNEQFNRRFVALTWKDLLAARILHIYFREAQSNFTVAPLPSNKHLNDRLNDKAFIFDKFQLRWDEEKGRKLRLWMFMCKSFSCGWAEQLSSRQGWHSPVPQQMWPQLVRSDATKVEFQLWMSKYYEASIEVLGSEEADRMTTRLDSP